MKTDIYIAPSILAADFANMGQEVIDVVEAGADWIHIDIMDGHFVPNLTFGPDLVRALRPKTRAFFDVHLMVNTPDSYIDAFSKAGADGITIHAEGNVHLHRTIQKIKACGKKVGIALNPATPCSVLLPVIDTIDLVVIMSVNPGFGGQKFIDSALTKIKEAHALIETRPILLEVDGGITLDNISEAGAAGANVFVAGSAIYAGGDKQRYKERIHALRDAAQQKIQKVGDL